MSKSPTKSKKPVKKVAHPEGEFKNKNGTFTLKNGVLKDAKGKRTSASAQASGGPLKRVKPPKK